MTRVSHQGRFRVPAAEMYAFHRDVRNLARVSPPFPRVRVEGGGKPAEPGDEQRVTLHGGLFRVRTRARITRLVPPADANPGYMEDTLVEGPFRYWRHQHQVFPVAEGCILRDVVEFELFPSRVGKLLDAVIAKPAFKLMFRYRHWRTGRLLRVKR